MAKPPRSVADEAGERAGQLADRRAGTGDDHGTGHGAHLPAGRVGTVERVATGGRAARGDAGLHSADRSRSVAAMQEILDAIQAGASGDELADLPIPESYRAAFVRKDEAACSRASPPRTRTPASRCTSTRSPLPELAPDEVVRRGDGQRHQLQHGVDLDLRAAARRSGSSTASARSRRGAPATTCRTTSSAPTPPASCCGSARPCATGSRATGSRPLQLRRRPGPVGPRRLDARRQPAHLGLRDELRRPGRPHRGQGQPAHAQAGPPHLGGGGRATRCATRPATACSCQPQRAPT